MSYSPVCVRNLCLLVCGKGLVDMSHQLQIAYPRFSKRCDLRSPTSFLKFQSPKSSNRATKGVPDKCELVGWIILDDLFKMRKNI